MYLLPQFLNNFFLVHNMAKYIEKKKSYLSLLLTSSPISENMKKSEKMILFTKKNGKKCSKKKLENFPIKLVTIVA